MERLTGFTDSEVPSGAIHVRMEHQIASIAPKPLLFEPSASQSQPLSLDATVSAGPAPSLSSSRSSFAQSKPELAGNRPTHFFRCCDLTIGTLLLVFVLPLMAFCAVAVMLSGRGALLFRQSRIGRGGREFTCLKFRTMTDSAESALEQVISQCSLSQQEWSAVYKLRADPRVTSVGKFLRRYSLDELPQLFNVLKGDMSVVGPRPIVRDEVGRFGPHFLDYCRVKPGLTGLWQISGRHALSYDERVRLDAEYANSKSLRLDLQILWRTVPIVLRGENE